MTQQQMKLKWGEIKQNRCSKEYRVMDDQTVLLHSLERFSVGSRRVLCCAGTVMTHCLTSPVGPENHTHRDAAMGAMIDGSGIVIVTTVA